MTSRVDSEYDRVRARHRAERDRRVQQIYAAIPELSAINAERSQLMVSVGRGQLSPADAREQLAVLTAREDALLSAHSFSRADMELTYTCEKCHDTGYIGGNRTMPCSCRLLAEAALDPEQSVNAKETFSHFDPAIYTDAGQKEFSLKVRDYCLRFADALPTPEKPFLLLMGDTGLGKSFFGNAIAYRALERGIPAVRLTAYAWQDRILKGMRSADGIPTDAVQAPLLSLDDLGSEPDIPNITNEHLFALINERMVAKRPTVIGTNFTLDMLKERYGDRIFSRLTDKSLVAVIRLTGNDLRRRGCRC